MKKEGTHRHFGDWLPDSEKHGPAAEYGCEYERYCPQDDAYHKYNQEPVDMGTNGENSLVKEEDAQFCTGQCPWKQDADGPFKLA